MSETGDRNDAPARPGRPADVGRTAPLSFAQQRLWLLDRLYPGEATYNEAIAVRIAGALDADALRRALNEVLRRHEALRTRFVVEDARPVQIVAPALAVALDVEDLGALPEADRAAEARRRARDERDAPFDLARGPLVRARLLRLAADEHWLFVTMHHIVTDGWSTGVLGHELGALYGAFREGRPSPLPGLAIQYADYAASQREEPDGDACTLALAWWKDALAGLPSLDLPADRPRAPIASHEGRCRTFEIGRASCRERVLYTV